MRIEEALKATDQLMLDAVESDVAVLQEASQHIIGAGGKRVRPRIMYLAYQSVGGGDDLDRAIPVAAAVELVHTATLVHDDINDHATTRRGRVTINQQWGRTFALLTGDYLFTKVYELMSPYKDLNITLAAATVELVEGETLQAAAAKDGNLNQETYQEIVAKKTASLFKAAAKLGAELADADAEYVEALGKYGFYVGTTFQIVDDLLDLIGDPRVTGKDAGLDLAQGKGVGSVIANANGRKRNGHGNIALAEPDVRVGDEHDPILDLRRQLFHAGAVEKGRMMASLVAQKARDALTPLPDSEAKEGLFDVVELVLNRNN